MEVQEECEGKSDEEEGEGGIEEKHDVVERE